MNPDTEIRRLTDIMPASGRMHTKIVSKPDQRAVIDCAFPAPWQREKPISINFGRWSLLPEDQRDLLLLRTVCWVTGIKWFRPNWLQGTVLVGALGTTIELMQADPMGIVVAGGLTAIAANQIWRNNRSQQVEVDADEAAIRVALRRGYTEADAARALLAAIDAVADMEGRPSLTFIELVRSQNLRQLAGRSRQSATAATHPG